MIEKYPETDLVLPDPGGPKTYGSYGSGSASGSTTLIPNYRGEQLTSSFRFEEWRPAASEEFSRRHRRWPAPAGLLG
jgi:hypothetical protein